MQQGLRTGLLINVVELVKHVSSTPVRLPTKSQKALKGRARQMARRRQKTAMLLQNIKREMQREQ